MPSGISRWVTATWMASSRSRNSASCSCTGLDSRKRRPRRCPRGPRPLFERLDADHDGLLTFVEFRRINQMRAGGPNGGGMGPFAKAGLAKKKAIAEPGAGHGLAAAEVNADAHRRPTDQARAAQVLRDQDPAGAGDEVRQVPCERRRKGQRGFAGRQPRWPAERGRHRPGRRAGQPRREPADHGDPLQGRLAPDAPQDKAARRGRRRFREVGQDGGARPARRLRFARRWRRSRRSTSRRAGSSGRFSPPVPSLRRRSTTRPGRRSDIDRFLLSALEAKGLKPVADAGRHALIRRVSFDLIGLPPSPEEVQAFVADTSDDAFAKVVDRLLASPRFGERWGRHWLDLARYAESSGNANMMYPQAWRYRDWVIAAFNADKPYDQFVKEQIAGDLLPARNDRERAEHLIATGFLAIGSKIHNMQNRGQFVLDLADEQIDAASQAFLGLTIACARCHDHKFDPISQRDYYALSGIFQSTQTCYGTLPGLVQNINPSPLDRAARRRRRAFGRAQASPDRREALEAQLAELVKARDALTDDDIGTPKFFQTRTRLAMLRFRLASYKPDGTPRTYAMGVRERFEPLDSPLYIRGELDQPGEPVPEGFVQVLSPRNAARRSPRGAAGASWPSNWPHATTP